MARVYTHKAKKDYPQQGIKKGDTYYEWAFYKQKAIKSKTPPTRSQLTQNEAEIIVYGVYDGEIPTTPEDIEEAAQTLRSAAEVEEGKKENLPEGFQQGEAGERLQNRADAINEAADTLDTLGSDIKDEADTDTSSEDFDGEDGTYYTWDAETKEWAINEQAVIDAFTDTEPELE